VPADQVLRLADDRVIGFVDYGPGDATPVLWCHGAPGSRFEPAWLQRAATAAGLRIVAMDRPGYGLSTPQPGRGIGDGARDVLLLAEHLRVERFVTVGVSTGGVYALATAARAPDRVIAALMCCAVGDMSWPPGRATMHGPQVHAVWDAPDRVAAMAAATDAYGDGFSKLLGGGMSGVLAPSDEDMFADSAWMSAAMNGFSAMSTFGMAGYVDDRIADGRGWGELDLHAIACPVTVLHGELDRIVDVMQARHTADAVPNARLVVVADAGHFSIERDIVDQIVQLCDKT